MNVRLLHVYITVPATTQTAVFLVTVAQDGLEILVILILMSASRKLHVNTMVYVVMKLEVIIVPAQRVGPETSVKQP